MRFLNPASRRGQRKALFNVRKQALAAAALAVLGSGSAALAQLRYWDVNGTTAGAGVTTASPDWLNGTISASGLWDGINTYWNTDSTGGAGGTLNTDISAGNTGVFAAGDPSTSYIVEIPGSTSVTAGGFKVNQGSVMIAGTGNGGKGGPFGGSSTASIVNIGTGTFNVDVATGATMHFGNSFRLPSFNGSAVVTKIGGGVFNNFADVFQVAGVTFTGKYDVQAGTMGIFFGGNSMLGNPGAPVADQLKVSNNAVIKVYQQSTSVSFRTNEGVSIGSGGATFFFAGAKDLSSGFGYATLGSIQFTSRISGGAEGARVPITITSNTLPGSGGIGQSTGTTAFNFLDNSTTTNAPALYAKWIVKSGELGPARASTTADTALGVVPPTYLADAITLDGGYLRPNAVMTIPATRGITLGAAGGGLHPVAAANPVTINSVITGAGQLRVYLENSATVKVILAGANDYTGGTWITGVGGTSQGTLQGTTTSLHGNIINDGRLIFDQTTNGSTSVAISGPGTLTKSNTGTAILNGNQTYTGATTVSGGRLEYGNSFRSGTSLTVANGATAAMSPRGAPVPADVLQVGTLNLNTTGTLDLNDNDLVVSSASFTTLQDLVLNGFSASVDPSKTGIISGTGQAGGGITILALFDNALVGASEWGGQPISANAIVGKYTYLGDLNLDGQVTGDDYGVIDANLDTTPAVGRGWIDGDANLDGVVTGDDYGVIDAALGNGSGNPLGASAVAVPEPASLLLALPLVLLGRRRRA